MAINNFMEQALNFVINLGLIVGVLAVIYAVIWMAIFVPIVKLRKHKQKVFEMERRYNKIEVEYATKMQLKEQTDEKLRKVLYILSQKEVELEKVTNELAEKEKSNGSNDAKQNKK